MSLSAEDIARIAAALAATGQTPAASPAAPVIASPFTSAGVAASDSRPDVVTAAIAAYPGDQKSQRRTIAASMIERYTCTVDTTATYADGTVKPSALHGFTTPRKSGDPCPGQFGVAADASCPGTIR